MADEKRQTPVPVPHIYGQPSQQPADPAVASTPANTGEAPTPIPSATTPAPTVEQNTSVAMTTEKAPSPAPAAAPATSTSNAPSPAPARTGTPLRNVNGTDNASSRAASQHPDSGFTMPAEAPPHGAPTRQYLNSKVCGPLLDGMKLLARERPKDPLRVLGEYLLQRSKELETS
ncbi:hypothetical protein F4819DRAFT_468280 [Hypoxylon fuscum]|nr:hypothetical protein F4819DRAFT_468280 [Hypoxylon fuscum]